MTIESEQDEDDPEQLGFGDTDFPPINSVKDYSERARRHGVIKEGELISRELHSLITEIVQECVSWAEKPQRIYSAAYAIGVMMLPEPYDGPTQSEKDLEELRRKYKEERPPTVLHHPGDEPGIVVYTPLPLPIGEYEYAYEGGLSIVRVIASGVVVYRGAGPVSMHAPYPPF